MAVHHINTTYTAHKQHSPFIREVKLGDGNLPDLLFTLLHMATPYGIEGSIIKVLPFRKEGRCDEAGNFIIKIGDAPTTMFSCHMDTVQTVTKECETKKVPGITSLLMMSAEAPEEQKGFVWAGLRNLKVDEKGNWYSPFVLGADDKVGVYTMCKMIEAGIPGLYVFHVGEEVGGKGSSWITKNTPGLVKGVQRCIAFDRAGYSDVIAFQRGRRTASKAFTDLVAEELNKHINLPHMKFNGDVRGVFTDSANYDDLIPECTNLSVGYFDQHGPNERFDYYWYETHFLPAVLKIKWDDIPVSRDPTKKDYGYTYDYDGYGGYYSSSRYTGKKVDFKDVTSKTAYCDLPDWNPEMGYHPEASFEGMSEIIRKWASSNYTAVGKFIASLLLEKQELRDEIEDFSSLIMTAKDIDELREFLSLADDTDTEEDTSEEPKLLEGPAFTITEANEKAKIINEMMIFVESQTIPQKKWKNQLDNSKRRYLNICKRLQDSGSVTPEDYKSLNEVMYTMAGVFMNIPDMCCELDAAVKDACRYMLSHAHEPGLEYVADAA